MRASDGYSVEPIPKFPRLQSRRFWGLGFRGGFGVHDVMPSLPAEVAIEKTVVSNTRFESWQSRAAQHARLCGSVGL